jgi:HEAT repeat protein
VPPLLEALRNKAPSARSHPAQQRRGGDNPDLRAVVARALAKIGSPAVPPLIKALGDHDLYVVIGAAEALGRIDDRRAIDPLLTCLASETSHVRQAACRALGEIGDQKAVIPLTEMLKDGDYDVRFAATAALGKVRDPRAVQPLIAALKHENPDVREAAAEALGQSGDTWAIEPLLAVLGDSRFSVQVAAARALGKLGEQAVQPLLHALRTNGNWNARYATAMALGLIGSERAVRPLIDALQDDDSRVRWNAAAALDKIGTAEALAAARNWRASQEQVWDYIDAGNERRLLETETGTLTGARIYRIFPLKGQHLREHDHLAISGTLTCAACEGRHAVTDIDVTLRRNLFDRGNVYTWTCPQCSSRTTISGYITTTDKGEPRYWLAVQRDSDLPTHGLVAGWPRLTIETLSNGEFEQVFVNR